MEHVIISVCWVSGAFVGLLPLFGWHAAVGETLPGCYFVEVMDYNYLLFLYFATIVTPSRLNTLPGCYFVEVMDYNYLLILYFATIVTPIGNTLPGCYFVEVMDYNYLLFLYFATIVTPSVLLAAFYAHIYRVVVQHMSEVMTVDGHGGRYSSGTMLRVLGAAQKREVKATQNLAIIVFFFIICWIPLYTINAIKAFMPELDIPNPLTYVCIIVSHLNSAINPLLYAYHLKDFRAALKGLICTFLGRGVPIPAAYRPPVPLRRPDLERCNAIRTRPKVYVNSPVWLRQKEEEKLAAEEGSNVVVASTPVVPDKEPFLQRIGADGSSGRHTPEGREGDGTPYLIHTSSERCQSPYRKVEELIRRVRSVSGEHSHS
ncbi:7 transmembrane receptor (rhodopsin family) domain-containing protein [Phthorimaea operculella]|nr:7 transmembrane receptor (rhodopsin family) domain-containing protein [Phthorimaea operculella]